MNSSLCMMSSLTGLQNRHGQGAGAIRFLIRPVKFEEIILIVSK